MPAIVAIPVGKGHPSADRQRRAYKAAYNDLGLLAFNIIDCGAKGTNFFSTCHDHVGKVKIVRRRFSGEHGRITPTEVERWNIQNAYNMGMNAVDVADQNRDTYRLNGQNVRYNKWWMCLFLWGFGMALSNGWKVYCNLLEGSETKKAPGACGVFGSDC